MKRMCADLESRRVNSDRLPADGFWDFSEYSEKTDAQHMTEFSSDTDAVLINIGSSDSTSAAYGCCVGDVSCADGKMAENSVDFDSITYKKERSESVKKSVGIGRVSGETEESDPSCLSSAVHSAPCGNDMTCESEEELYRIDLGDESEDSTLTNERKDRRNTELSKLFERLRERTRRERTAERAVSRAEYALDSGYTVSIPRTGITRSSDIIRSYESEHPLIKTVEVLRWPSVYSFYERFRADAVRYFQEEGQECEYEDFVSFVPQYAAMTDAQRKYYFNWRGRLRKGEYIRASKSYVLLLLCEIINLPDLLKPYDGIKLMCELVVHYHENIYGIRRSVSSWIRDYCLIHGVSVPPEYMDAMSAYAGNAIMLPEFFVKYDPATKKPDPLSMLDMMSHYSWKDSKYINNENREVFEKYMTGALTAAFNACGDELLPEDDRTRMSKYISEAYSGAVCTSDIKCRIKLIYLKCAGADEYRYATGIIKYTENCTRRLLGVKARFKITELPRRATEAVDRYFAPLFEEQMLRRNHRKGQDKLHAEDIPEYEKLYDAESTGLSFEHALEIEKNSWKITERLMDAFCLSENNIDGGADGAESTAHSENSFFDRGAEAKVPESNCGRESNCDKKENSDLSNDFSKSVSEADNALARTDCGSGLSEKYPGAVFEEKNPPADVHRDDGRGSQDNAEELCRQGVILLLNGDVRGFDRLASENRLLPDTLAERINELFYDSVGDIVLEQSDSGYTVIEDYRAETEEFAYG